MESFTKGAPKVVSLGNPSQPSELPSIPKPDALKVKPLAPGPKGRGTLGRPLNTVGNMLGNKLNPKAQKRVLPEV